VGLELLLVSPPNLAKSQALESLAAPSDEAANIQPAEGGQIWPQSGHRQQVVGQRGGGGEVSVSGAR
jgi:hypothetical protein